MLFIKYVELRFLGLLWKIASYQVCFPPNGLGMRLGMCDVTLVQQGGATCTLLLSFEQMVIERSKEKNLS